MNDQKTSWRSISQQLGGPAITPIAQKRRTSVLQKRLFSLGLALVLMLGLGGAAYYLSTHSTTFAPYAQAQDKTQFVFFSDGQLTEAWFQEQFAALRQKGLLSIDIAALQSRLMKNPQVMEATIERQFPSTLKITLRERQPLARIQLKIKGQIQLHYVARDGQFFQSSQLKPSAHLPYLAGLSVRPGPAGELPPMPGVVSLAEIIDGLKERFPELFVQIHQIDLKNWVFPLAPQTMLSLRTRSGNELRFAPTGIGSQLDRLQETLRLLATEATPFHKKLIDLTTPERVAVTDLK